MARSNSTIRGAGGTPPGMVDVLSPANTGAPDVVAERKNALVGPGMMRTQAAKDNLLPDKNVDRTPLIVDFSVVADEMDVQFTALVTGADIATYLWDFGDGDTSTDKNPSHTYADPDTYDVSLTVGRVGTYGAVSQDDVTTTKTFTVPGMPTIVSFTPSHGAVASTVTLTGANLVDLTSIAFDLTEADLMTAVYDLMAGTVEIDVPVAATSGKIHATNESGTADSATDFTVDP